MQVESSSEIQTSPWVLDSNTVSPEVKTPPKISEKNQNLFDPSFFQQLKLNIYTSSNKKKFNFSQDSTGISPLQIAFNKSISVFEQDSDLITSPLISFLPNSHLIRNNSECVHYYENDNSRSVNFGDNKYTKQKNMIIEELQSDLHKTTMKFHSPHIDTRFFKNTSKKIQPRTPRSIVKNLDESIRMNYQPIKLIGRGKIGEVFQVKSKIDGLFYAIKKIQLTEFEDFSRAQFRTEVQFLAKLVDEQHLVRFHDSQVHNDHLYIIMEHCGHSLREMHATHTRAYESQLRQILHDICQILDVLQSKFLKAHLNINPGNILLSKNKRYKLGDFGLQSLNKNDNSWDKEIKYSAPEIDQVDPDETFFNDKADVYSLGVVLYELMTEREIPKTQRLSHVMIPRLDVINHYSHSLKSLVKRMVKTDPKLRPSFKDILKTLKIDVDEELALTIRENNEMQKQIFKLQNNGTHKKNLSF